jgi:hypothetical protein
MGFTPWLGSASNDLGSSVWSSLHQTQPSFTDSTVLSFSHATFIHSRHNYMFVSSTNHAFNCARLITVVQCRSQLFTNKMYYIVTTTQSQIGCSTVSICHIHVYYGVVNVLWAHRNKSICKLHMHHGLQDIWYRNNMFRPEHTPKVPCIFKFGGGGFRRGYFPVFPSSL